MPGKEIASKAITNNLQTEHREAVRGKDQQGLESQVSEFLDRLGVKEKIESLDSERSAIVTNVIASLWSINEFGLEIEKSDQQIIADDKTYKLIDEKDEENGVSVRLKKIKDTFHDENDDWFNESVITVVNAAHNPVFETQKVSKELINNRPAKYRYALESAGSDYGDTLPLFDEDNRESAQNYVNGRRPSTLVWMKMELDEYLTPEVNKLVPFEPN